MSGLKLRSILYFSFWSYHGLFISTHLDPEAVPVRKHRCAGRKFGTYPWMRWWLEWFPQNLVCVSAAKKKNGKEKAISDPGDLPLEALAFTLFEWLSTLSLPCSRDSVRTTKVRYHSATELIRICMPRLGRSQNAWAVGESNGSREEKFEEKFP